jgi:hypothetical protein
MTPTGRAGVYVSSGSSAAYGFTVRVKVVVPTLAPEVPRTVTE